MLKLNGFGELAHLLVFMCDKSRHTQIYTCVRCHSGDMSYCMERLTICTIDSNIYSYLRDMHACM